MLTGRRTVPSWPTPPSSAIPVKGCSSSSALQSKWGTVHMNRKVTPHKDWWVRCGWSTDPSPSSSAWPCLWFAWFPGSHFHPNKYICKQTCCVIGTHIQFALFQLLRSFAIPPSSPFFFSAASSSNVYFKMGWEGFPFSLFHFVLFIFFLFHKEVWINPFFSINEKYIRMFDLTFRMSKLISYLILGQMVASLYSWSPSLWSDLLSSSPPESVGLETWHHTHPSACSSWNQRAIFFYNFKKSCWETMEEVITSWHTHIFGRCCRFPPSVGRFILE